MSPPLKQRNAAKSRHVDIFSSGVTCGRPRVPPLTLSSLERTVLWASRSRILVLHFGFVAVVARSSGPTARHICRRFVVNGCCLRPGDSMRPLCVPRRASFGEHVVLWRLQLAWSRCRLPCLTS